MAGQQDIGAYYLEQNFGGMQSQMFLYDDGDPFHACYNHQYLLENHRKLRVFGVSQPDLEQVKLTFEVYGAVERVSMEPQPRGEFVCTVVMQRFEDARKAAASIRLIPNPAIGTKPFTIDETPADSCLFIGNIAHDMSYDKLRRICDDGGRVRSLHMVNEITDPSSRKGYAIVEYVSRPEAVRAKQHLSVQKTEDRVFRVDWADCKTLKSLHSPVLFVDKLPRDFKDDAALSHLFAPFGKLVECSIILNHGVPRGHAFVIYEYPQDAERARKFLNETTFRSSQIRISFGKPGVTPDTIKSIMAARNDSAYPATRGSSNYRGASSRESYQTQGTASRYSPYSSARGGASSSYDRDSSSRGRSSRVSYEADASRSGVQRSPYQDVSASYGLVYGGYGQASQSYYAQSAQPYGIAYQQPAAGQAAYDWYYSQQQQQQQPQAPGMNSPTNTSANGSTQSDPQKAHIEAWVAYYNSIGQPEQAAALLQQTGMQPST